MHTKYIYLFIEIRNRKLLSESVKNLMCQNIRCQGHCESQHKWSKDLLQQIYLHHN